MSPHYKKTFLFLGIIFFVICLLLFIFVYKKINSNNKSAMQSQIEWQTEANQREEINSLDSSLKSIEDQRVQIESHFAKSSDIVPFLNTIEQLGTQVKSVANVSSVDILKDDNSLLVGIKATGSFEAVYKFLLLIENSPYELEFLGVDMQKDADSGPTESTDKTTTPSLGWTGIFKVKLLSFVN